MTPNEARKKENLNPYELGDEYYMAMNIAPVGQNIENGNQEIL